MTCDLSSNEHLQMGKVLSCSCCWSLAVGSEFPDSRSLRQAVCKSNPDGCTSARADVLKWRVALASKALLIGRNAFCYFCLLCWLRGAAPDHETSFWLSVQSFFICSGLIRSPCSVTNSLSLSLCRGLIWISCSMSTRLSPCFKSFS